MAAAEVAHAQYLMAVVLVQRLATIAALWAIWQGPAQSRRNVMRAGPLRMQLPTAQTATRPATSAARRVISRRSAVWLHAPWKKPW